MQPDSDGMLGVATAVEDRWRAQLDSLDQALEAAVAGQRRADCMARIQTDAVQLALDLLGREPDIDGFFRLFTASLVNESESHACGVWLLNDDKSGCTLWMAYADGAVVTSRDPGWDSLAQPREALAAHLVASREGWTSVVSYSGDDPRLPPALHAFHHEQGIESLIVAPMVMAQRTLGWFALSSLSSSSCEVQWRGALVQAMARQATLALHQSRLAEQSRLEARRQAVLEERNRIARDIHDTLTQGFAAILMQLQAAQRSGPLPPHVAGSIETAIDLARTHMIEARRSVGALRPQQAGTEDVAAALARMAELARRTTDVPIELHVGEVPSFDGGVDREIVAIAQEALANAVRHARARTITVQAESTRSLGFRLTVADDGRGIPKEHRKAGFGMTSMQERAERIGASLTIVTAPRAGTQIVLAWEPPSFSIPADAHA